MNGLALVLALAVGQDCPDGSCQVRSRVTTASYPNPAWEAHAVRVIVDHGSSQDLGSGTIIGSDDKGRELVVTAGHVLGRERSGIRIRYRGQVYPTRWLGMADDGDIAALEADIPGTVRPLNIAEQAPSRAMMLGYGQTGHLHSHSGYRVGSATPDGDSTPDHEYSFGAEQGDSGGGVIDPDGKFAGVLWGTSGGTSMVVSTAKVRRFLQCDERRGFALTPIGIFCWRRQDSGGSRVVVRPPSVEVRPDPVYVDPGPVVVSPPIGGGVSVQVGPVGPRGPVGPAGQDGVDGKPGKDGLNGKDGKDADPAALAALTAQINTLTTNMAKLTTIVTTIQNHPDVDLGPLTIRIAALEDAVKNGAGPASQPPPIFLRFLKPDGSPGPTTKFDAQLDPNGKPFYSIELNPTTLPPTTIPVTPPTPGK